MCAQSAVPTLDVHSQPNSSGKGRSCALTKSSRCPPSFDITRCASSSARRIQIRPRCDKTAA
eukprot:6173926-Pleurochrysis_carterae.AAC.1